MDKLLYFSAPWCGPCIVVGKSVEKIDAQYPDLEVEKINIDDQAETASEYGVKSIPTLVYLRDGEEIARVVGARTKEDLVNELKL